MSVHLPSILITDDDLEFRETLASVFEPEAFQIYLAGDGEEALDIVRNDDVHLVLIDMHMPKLTGLEVVREARRLRSRLPFILLSADLDEEIVSQAYQLRTFSVLPKPVSQRNIKNVVRQAFRWTYDWPRMLGGRHGHTS